MEVYTVRRTEDADGWSGIPVLSIGRVLGADDLGIRAWGQLCHTETELRVRLFTAEKDVRATCTEPVSPVHEDSCLEFFFRREDSPNYFNFEINPNGCLRIQYGPDRFERVDLVRRDGREYFGIRTGRTADGWEAAYRIPLAFLRLFHPEHRFGDGLLANFYKCGDKTKVRHYLCWSPIDLPKPDFHRPEFFGRLLFE